MGNTWHYDAGNYWQAAGEGLSIRCIEEEGMNTWQDEIITWFGIDYFDYLISY